MGASAEGWKGLGLSTGWWMESAGAWLGNHCFPSLTITSSKIGRIPTALLYGGMSCWRRRDCTAVEAFLPRFTFIPADSRCFFFFTGRAMRCVIQSESLPHLAPERRKQLPGSRPSERRSASWFAFVVRGFRQLAACDRASGGSSGNVRRASGVLNVGSREPFFWTLAIFLAPNSR